MLKFLPQKYKWSLKTIVKKFASKLINLEKIKIPTIYHLPILNWGKTENLNRQIIGKEIGSITINYTRNKSPWTYDFTGKVYNIF